MRANGGEHSLVMQSFYQFIIDDLSELGLEELALKYNKIYKQTLKKFYKIDDVFYIAYTIDIVA